MYQVSQTIISKKRYPELYNYFLSYCSLSKNLYNASLYRLRQNFTSFSKEVLTSNENEVKKEIELTVLKTGLEKPKYSMNYRFLEKLMRVTNNSDFFTYLPMQTAQAVLKDAVNDFKCWLASARSYHLNPTAFTGRPKMPKYKKSDLNILKFTNQDCTLRNGILKLPKTKITIPFPNIQEDAKLKEVQVKPYYNHFKVIVITEVKEDSKNKNTFIYACGIDFGVDNIASIVSNDGKCLLYKGNVIKSVNRRFNKRYAELSSVADKLKQPKITNRMKSVSDYRNRFIHDYFHKISSDFVKYCIENKIGKVVMGSNKGWKQNINIGRTNNQNFVSIPYETLKWMLKYKLERNYITVIEREESYTSKASFLDNDEIPTYKEESEKTCFSGRRITRGSYKSKDGTVINADLNGAANILRKEMPDASITVSVDFFNIKTKSYKDFYPCSPVKGIVAV